MNGIREIQRLNKLELENGVAPEASWHRDHADSAYIYIGGLPFDLSEGDIITIFSQFGEPTFVKLVRDKETGKSKGFAFLKYEDQRSTDLAVDNLGGATVMGRILKVDHTKYKMRDDEEEEGQMANGGANRDAKSDTEKEEEERRPVLKEEKELAALLRDHDEDDPMKEYLVQEKKEEVARALAKLKKGDRKDGEKKHHRHHHKHRSKRDASQSDSDRDRRRHKHRSRRGSDSSEEEERRRRRHRSDRRRSRSPR
ncbi:RNA-binding protein Cwf29 [Xanthoria calcicola]